MKRLSNFKLVDSGKSDYVILIASKVSKVENFAVSELQCYIEKISGVRLPIIRINKKVEGKYILFGTSIAKVWGEPSDKLINNLGQDEFLIKTVDNNLLLAGGNDRGSLYSVYTFLELLGISWINPLSFREIIPKKRIVEISHLDIIDKPSFRWRSLDASGFEVPFNNKTIRKTWLEEAKIIVDWMAKNKLNHIFFSNVSSDIIQELYPEIKKRGIDLECGGHLFDQFLPRELYDKHPEYFRLWNGKRQKDNSLCASNKSGLEIMKTNALRYVAERHESDVFHLWPADGLKGWCECGECKDLSPSDQCLKVHNELRSELDKTNRHIRTSFIAYHSTFSKVEKIKPNSNILLFWACRQRCYSHPIDSQGCARNVWFRKKLEEWFEIFGDKFYPFEYYHDSILFRSMTVPIHEVIRRDLQYYKKLGLDKVQSLVLFGNYSFWAYPLNLYAFAKYSWNVNYAPDLIKDYCKHLFGEESYLMEKYYMKLEKAMSKVIAFCDYSLDLNYDLNHYFIDDKEPFVKTHLTNVENALELLSECKSILDRASKMAADVDNKERIERSIKILLYTQNEVNSIYHQLTSCNYRMENQFDEAKKEDLKTIELLKKSKKIMNDFPDALKGAYYKSFFNRDHDRIINGLLTYSAVQKN